MLNEIRHALISTCCVRVTKINMAGMASSTNRGVHVTVTDLCLTMPAKQVQMVDTQCCKDFQRGNNLGNCFSIQYSAWMLSLSLS